MVEIFSYLSKLAVLGGDDTNPAFRRARTT
jgi:hypothetical protein